MKTKTPLQELIEELEIVKHTTGKEDIHFRVGIKVALDLAREKLEKEQEEIQNAYANGAIDFQSGKYQFTNGDDIEYYKNKFE